MFWNEEEKAEGAFVIPDDVVDLNFKVRCKQLPIDHASTLFRALSGALPWLEQEPLAAVHLIHGAESGNGWIRPDNPQDLIFPSRRTRFTLRLPKHRVEDAKALDGKVLDLNDYQIELSHPSIRPLSTQTTIFSRHVVCEYDNDEDAFLQAMYDALVEKDIVVKKMMGGRSMPLQIGDQQVQTQSLMIDGLKVEQSIRLQQEGLGAGRKYGCGIFLPHKGIDAVNTEQEK